MITSPISRRIALSSISTGVLGLPIIAGTLASSNTEASETQMKGRLKQSVSKWCYNKFIEANSFAKFCEECKKMGMVGIDLVGPDDWPVILDHGLVPTMVPGAGSIANSCNNKNLHPKLLEDFKKNITAAAKHKIRNVITFSGNRHGMTDEEGWENCTPVLKEAAKIAEAEGVTINMELLNSKVDHKDYQCDHTEWGVELCKRVESPHFKLLYDIYHMQIMEGDIIRTIRKHIQYIGHFHTGGNPGRNEIDETQELYYPAIMCAIAELDYDGYVAHEFVPKQPSLDTLQAAVKLCDV
ncbi:MAG: hydroxypyruvate isomerase [Candidatus Omnitrophota bacterium]|jgi:hydroxypyruvate isomerase|nr:MAG: hydroxypyruvate isomerase [Candidatus Omnitrophota bacterium]